MHESFGMVERWVPYQGGQIRYVIGGSGKPLVLCHGFLGSAESFEQWYEALTPRRTLIIPDLPGCGLSSPLKEKHDALSLGRAVMAVIDDANVTQFDLGGLCLGAEVALAVVHERSSSIGQLFLHTPLLAPFLVQRHIHWQVAVLMAPGMFQSVAWFSRNRLISDLYKRVAIEDGDVDADAAALNFTNQRRANPRAARQWLRSALQRENIATVLDRDEPALVMVAEKDRVVDIPRLQKVVSQNDNVQFVVIEDAGHGWNTRYVQKQLAILGAFLDGLPVPELDSTTEAA